ncbi:MAG: hypothetical protein LAT57_09365 [Balneolales bacterium]|nr:hypothetical protein [Balneolales bacterium]
MRYATILLLLVLISSCSRDSDQEQFEREAFASPQNITETTAGGEIIATDPDDWRIAPLFQGYVEVFQPPYPNPSPGTRFTLEILITGLESVYGLEIYTRDTLGRPSLIYTDNRRPMPPGITDIIIEPVWLSPTGNYNGALGIHRIFVYDGSGNMITYGDLLVE